MMTPSQLADAILGSCGLSSPTVSSVVSKALVGDLGPVELGSILDRLPLTTPDIACILSYFPVGA
jgi:hypothetical protein